MTKRNKTGLLSLSLALCLSMGFVLTSCEGAVGPQGPQGAQGAQGEQGVPGKDGLTPFIGENGNWWIGDKDTGIYAGDSITPPQEVLDEIVEMEVAATGKQKGFVVNGKYYTDYATLEEQRAAAKELNIQAEAEGIVLLKNENNALPLSKTAKITLLGYTTQNITKGGGSGSGRPGQYGVPSNTLQYELEASGFKVNPATINYYAKNKKEVGELPASVQATYASYDDAAVVMFSRVGSESSDRATYGQDTNKDKHYLEFTDAEQALIMHAKENFKKVVVLLNTGNIMEVGNINEKKTADNLGVDAVMWIGLTGNDGAAAIGRVLNGEISPSGRTADTWMADFTQEPTYFNFGANNQNVDADGNRLDTKIYNEAGEAQNSSANLGSRVSYNSVEYREGIYVGYRYWETKGAIEGEDWYKENVVYPFGYGLSYTTFEHEITSNVKETGKITKANSTITLQVKVTNTGKVAGKDVVQAYYTPPYTNGGIEKSEVNLAAFAKTDVLQPGESQIVTLQFVAQDMASFDWNDANGNDFLGYELEKGDYKISVRSNAHEEIASITRTVDNDIKCTTDYTTGAEIKSLFTGTVDGLERYKSTNDTLEENMMTRANGLQLPEACSKEDRTWTEAQINELESQITYYSYMDEESNPWYVSSVPTGWTQAADTSGREDGKTAIQLKDLFGKAYTEPTVNDGVATAATDEDTKAWDAYLNQFTWEELATIVAYGGFGEIEVESVGKNASGAYDAAAHPFWNGGMFGGAKEPENQMGTNWCIPAVWGCTWNTDLLAEMGRMIGNEALFFNIEGLYGFSVNIHRSPFGGRNFEYISEDGLLTGKLAAAANKEITKKGLVTFTKHFMMNNQETDRNSAGGVLTWATEQAIREIYGRPYEYGVKDGGNSGFMTGFNRIGMQTCSTNWSLLEGLVRNEWGFNGDIVTDYLDYKEYRYTGLMVRTGNEIPLGNADKKIGKGKGGVCSFPEGTWDAASNSVLVAANSTNAIAAENARLAGGIGADCSAYETVASPTHWFNVRKSAQRILYAMANGLGSLNGNAYKMSATIELKVNEALQSVVNNRTQKYIDLNAAVKNAVTLAEGSELTSVVCKATNTAPATGLTFNPQNGQLSGTLPKRVASQ